MIRFAAVSLLCACGGSSSRVEPVDRSHGCDNVDQRPGGTIADYHAPEIEGFAIAAPATCPSDHDSAYIRVERTHGVRTLGTGKRPDGGFQEGCTQPPADPADPAQCPILDWSVPIQAVHADMDSAHMIVNGIGAGACADTSGDYAAWRMSIGVTSWKEAEAIVRRLAAAMDRLDVRGLAGVSVRGIRCGVAD